MRTRLLTALIVGSTLSTGAYASGDDSCYPRWSIFKENLEACSNLAFLSPGNDSQVNLRLLLADQGALPLTPQPLNATDLEQGYGPVPFAVSRLNPVMAAEPGEAETPAPRPDPLAAQLQTMGLTRPASAAGEAFLDGEGSRCRSNDQTSATHFISQVLASPDLSDSERKALAGSRLHMLEACDWPAEQQSSLIPTSLTSTSAQAFATYLRAASDFYSGRFDAAAKGFADLQSSPNTWLKQTSAYMSARTALNQAQQSAFNEYSELTPEALDKALLQQAEQGFEHYLAEWPAGDYSVSARGLLRRVHWLAARYDKLADEYAWQLTRAQEPQRNLSLDALINEVDVKLLMVKAQPLHDPMLLAVSDLMNMREQARPRLTLADLQAQQAVFAAHPALYDYLLAAHALYVRDDPAQALKHLPELAGDLAKADYLSLSQQMLRGLALQARQDWKAAQQT